MSPLLLIMALLGVTQQTTMPNYDIFSQLPVTDINYDIPDNEIQMEIQRLIGIENGEKFSRKKIRQATVRLYNTGRFQYIDVNAGRKKGGMSLTFTLKAKQYIKGITLVGVDSLENQEEFTKALGYNIGDEYNPDVDDRLRENAISYLHNHGYWESTVTVENDNRPPYTDTDPYQRTLTIFIIPQERTYIDKIVFSGETALDHQVLERQLRSRTGKIFSQELLDKDRNELLAKYRAHGFLEATIDQPQISIEDNHATVTIPVHSGQRIRLEFSGNNVLSDQYLSSLLKIRSGDGINRSQLTNLREEIHTNYLERGYYEAAVTIETITDPGQLDKIYRFVIDEGPYLPVADVTFNGVGRFYKNSREARDEFFAFMRSEYNASIFGQLLDNDDLHQTQGPAVGRTDARVLNDGQVQLNKASISAQDPTHVYIDWLYKKALEHLRGTYRSNGYLGMRFSQPQVNYDATSGGNGPNRLQVTINIQEGPQTIVTQRTIIGLPQEALDQLDKKIPLQEEEPLSETAIDKTRQLIRNYYTARGHIYAAVNIDYQLSPDHTTAQVLIRVNPGPQVHVGMIIIQGREFVRQQVILAQLTMKSGDIFRPAEAQRSRQFLMSLGVFSMASVELADPQTPAPQKDLIVRVTERNRHSLGAGIGLSTEDGVRASLQYSHLNLFGVALGLNTSLKINRQFFFTLYGSEGEQMARRYQHYKPFSEALERQLRLTLTAPYLGFLPREISLSISLINERDNTLSYSLDSSSATLGINYKPRRQLNVQLEQAITYNSLQCVTGDDCSNPIDDRGNIKRIDAGTYLLYKVIPSLKLEFRDNSFNPHKGFWSNISLEYSKGIGKPISFFKLEGQFSFYIPAGKRVTIAIATNMGQIFNLGDSFPISDSFYFGGRSSVRGYYERSVIPSDICVVGADGRPIYGGSGCSDTLNATAQADGTYYVQTKGGRTYGLFRLEGRIKLYQQLSLGLFTDVGNLVMDFSNLFKTAPRFGLGFGLRYETPLGPLALDFGFDPFPREALGEGIFQLHFSVGLF